MHTLLFWQRNLKLSFASETAILEQRFLTLIFNFGATVHKEFMFYQNLQLIDNFMASVNYDISLRVTCLHKVAAVSSWDMTSLSFFFLIYGENSDKQKQIRTKKKLAFFCGFQFSRMSVGEPGYPDPDDFDGDLYERLKMLPDGKIMDREWIRRHICPEATGELYTFPTALWMTEERENK